MAVVRLLASITWISLTRTPASRASATTSPRSGSWRSVVKRLKSGSSTIGLTITHSAPPTTTTAAPGTHQPRGSLRISHSSANASSPIRTALIVTDSSQSHAQPGHERVFSPTSRERIRSTIVIGSVTTLMANAIAAPARPPCHHAVPRRFGGLRTSATSSAICAASAASEMYRLGRRKSCPRSICAGVK